MRRFSRGIRPPGAPTSIRPPSTSSTDGLPSGADHESATTGPKRPRRTPQPLTGNAQSVKPHHAQ